ncbi:hypothetical protein NECAME_10656 [Necator americanus]|uniref:Uncharacterized protein n=1 Tax=Necator americanus TaxID=51031 RepID=W2T9S0_NECAM|nr:hypothetical protein NECAME_10656 [Necator americanus]ETN77956.1 hypothetical protein NECAME_10656 [Necator americanus]
MGSKVDSPSDSVRENILLAVEKSSKKKEAARGCSDWRVHFLKLVVGSAAAKIGSINLYMAHLVLSLVAVAMCFISGALSARSFLQSLHSAALPITVVEINQKFKKESDFTLEKVRRKEYCDENNYHPETKESYPNRLQII